MAGTTIHPLLADAQRSPFKASFGKTMMWIFLLSDALTFSGLLVSYGTIRMSSETWANPEEVFAAVPFFHDLHAPLVFVGLMTFILIVSSVTMVLAVEAGFHMDKKNCAKFLFFTILGGLTFLSCQAWEWTHLIMGGTTIHGNPYGPVAFGQFFFLITGFHGGHVLSGVIINTIVLINVLKGTYERRGHYEMVEKVGLYWHFVDLVWVFVFTFFYLI